jgi:hypothetical protein
MSTSGVYVARPRRDMAHPIYEDWPTPSRWRNLQYAAAVVVQALLILAIMAGILALGGLAGAVLGVDMNP